MNKAERSTEFSRALRVLKMRFDSIRNSAKRTQFRMRFADAYCNKLTVRMRLRMRFE